jgi:glucose dehydrogenase
MRVQTIGAVLVGALIGFAQAQEPVPAREWRYFGGDKAFTRYSQLDQITRDNVKDLRIVWRRPAVSDQLTQAFPDRTEPAEYVALALS